MRIRQLIETLRNDLRPDTARGKLVRSTGASAMLKAGATFIALLASLVYARALGPHNYGLYAYVIAWITVLTIPASLGIPNYLVREGAKAQESLSWLRSWADKRIIVSGASIALIIVAACFIPKTFEARWLFVLAAPLPILTNLGAVRRALLQAQNRIAQSQWPLLILAPATVLAASFLLWLIQGTFSPVALMAVTVSAAILPALIGAMQLRASTRPKASRHPHPAQIRDALSFMWLGGMYLLVSRTDIIMLGTLHGAHDAGIYTVASRAAEALLFIGWAATTAVAPRFAKLHHDGQHETLQRLLSAMGRRTLILTLPPAVLMIILAGPLLQLLYGHDYLEGKRVLQILCITQLMVVSSGPLGTLLNMSGHEKIHLYGIASGVAANIILNFLLIPAYGAMGAAMATCASVIFFKSLLLVLVRRNLGIRPSALGL